MNLPEEYEHTDLHKLLQSGHTAFLKLLEAGLMPTSELVKAYLEKPPGERQGYVKQLQKRVSHLAETEAPEDEVDRALMQTVFTGASEEEISQAVQLAAKSARQPLFAGEPIRFTVGKGEVDYSAASVEPANEVAALVRRPLAEQALEILGQARELGPKIRRSFVSEFGGQGAEKLEAQLPKASEAQVADTLGRAAKVLYASYHQDSSPKALELADKASLALAHHENPALMQASGHDLLLNAHELVTDRLHDVRGRILQQVEGKFLETVGRHPLGKKIVLPRLQEAAAAGKPIVRELKELIARVKALQRKAGGGSKLQKTEFLSNLVAVLETSWTRLHPVSPFAQELAKKLAEQTSKIRVSTAAGKDEVALVASNRVGDRLVKHYSDDCVSPDTADAIDNVRIHIGGKWMGNAYTATGTHGENKVLLVDALQLSKESEVNQRDFVKQTVESLWNRAQKHAFDAIVMSSQKAFWSNRNLVQNAVGALYGDRRTIKGVSFERNVSNLQSVKHGEYLIVAGRIK